MRGKKFEFISGGKHRDRTHRPASFETLEPRVALSGPDPAIAESLLLSSGQSDELHAQLASQHYFVHYDLRYGQELWVSNDEDQPARMVTDLNPGPADSRIKSIVAAGDFVFFTAFMPDDSGDVQRRLFRTDGTPEGTVQITDRIVALGELTVFQDRVLFYSPYSFLRSHPGEVWITDGTDEGTQRLYAAEREIAGEGPYFAVLDDRFYFRFGSIQKRYYVSDGSVAGTRPLSLSVSSRSDGVMSAFQLGSEHLLITERNQDVRIDQVKPDGSTVSLTEELRIQLASYSPLEQVGAQLFFADTDWKLWHSDGTLAGTRPLDMSGFLPDQNVRVTHLSAVGSRLVFQFSFDSHLASYDTVTGEFRVFPDSTPSESLHLASGNHYYFVSHGRLMRLDVVSGQLSEIAAFDSSATLNDLIAFRGQVLVRYTVLSQGGKTVVIRLLSEKGLGDVLAEIPQAGDDVIRTWVGKPSDPLIVTHGSSNEARVYRSDSPESRLSLLASTSNPFHYAGAPSRRDNHTILDQTRFVFTGEDSRIIWISDGTQLGTRILFSLDAMPDGTIAEAGARIRDLYAIDGKLVFSVYALESANGNRSRTLWAVDQDGDSRSLYRPGDGWGYVFDILGSVNDHLMFVTQGTTGEKLQTVWRTSSGLRTIEPVLTDVGAASRIGEFDRFDEPPRITADERLFFRVDPDYRIHPAILHERLTADAVFENQELWSKAEDASLYLTDGSIEGTQLLLEPSDLCLRDACWYTRVAVASELAWIRADEQLAQMPDSGELFPLPESLTTSFEPLGVLSGNWIATDGTRVVRWDVETGDVEQVFEASAPNSISVNTIFAGDKLFLTTYPADKVFVLDGTVGGTHELEFGPQYHQKSIYPAGGPEPGVIVQSRRTDGGWIDHFWLVEAATETVVDLGASNLRTFTSLPRPIGMHSDILHGGAVFAKKSVDVFVDSPGTTIAIEADDSTVKLVAGDEVVQQFSGSVAVVRIDPRVEQVTIDLQALAESTTRDLDLHVPDGAAIRLVGRAGQRIVYTSTDAGVLIQVAGLELEFQFESSISLADDLGVLHRDLRASPRSDRLNLSTQDGQPTFAFDDGMRAWNLVFESSSDLVANDIRVNLLSGKNEVVVDPSFDVPGTSNGIFIEIDQAVDGVGQTSLSIPPTFSVSKWPPDAVVRRNDNPKVQIRLSVENRPFQNPANRYDTNLDGSITPADALMIINTLERATLHKSSWPGFPDVSGDGQLTPMDALMVINQMARDHAILSVTNDLEDKRDVVSYLLLDQPKSLL
ncbi:hypothetical protein FYK55_05905 [Roseiconus nitratireducens]|uniref:Dockerin type I repeat protein n=1 Tax=Roseiconus nitratireducens TaxID=2605748 RepID=A0A5M6DCG8_9BACT|nr:dockerin type I domain-containing protein [Roseiconus nitratireducens]KAA5545204.1 hypothetical protein FYK55_05905 [Roseiconus nitratireducens]